jgi:succinate-semialdehyde dehydrogenase/glutarate-semialdehyde dehydrogenase
MTLTAINPADGTELARFEEPSDREVAAAIERAHDAFGEWRARPLAERCELLRSLAATLRFNKAKLAREATLEMGKILREAEGEVEKSAVFCEYYAENAERLLAPQAIDGGGSDLGGDAVELPICTGLPLCAADARGRQRGAAQACVERPRLRYND